MDEPPKNLFEVAVVKICQTAQQSAGDIPEVGMLMNKIQQLEQEVERLKTSGVKVQMESAPKEAPRPQKGGKSHYKAPVGRIHEILKEATRPDLEQLKSSWGKLLAHLKQQNKVSHAAL